MAENGQLMGSQTPRIDVTPLYFTSAGDDAVDLAAVAGLHLDPWQQHVLRGALGERVDGRWKAFEVGVIVPRQNGKGSILEARELAGMFLFGERLILHSAHLFGTAVEHQQRLESLIRGSELVEYMAGYAGDPQGKMSGIKTGNSGMSLTTASGSRVLFKARSRGSARGFTADLVVFDEAYDLPRSVQASMLPTLASKSLNESPQIWYASSAGMPDSEVLKSIRDRALSPAEETKLAFYEWSTTEDADPADPANWALANPALGRRISAEYVDSERRAMSDEHFKRERLGIWSRLVLRRRFLLIFGLSAWTLGLCRLRRWRLGWMLPRCVMSLRSRRHPCARMGRFTLRLSTGARALSGCRGGWKSCAVSGSLSLPCTRRRGRPVRWWRSSRGYGGT